MDLEDLDKKTIIKISLAGIGVIILLICIFGAWFTVDAGEIGIVTRFGEVQRVAESGFNFKVPIIDGVTKMETRIQKEEVESSAVSKDLQEVNAKLALNYSINKETALKLYKEVGINYKDNIIGYKYVNLGRMMDGIKAGVDPMEAIAKATGTYGRFDDAVKTIDPRQE